MLTHGEQRALVFAQLYRQSLPRVVIQIGRVVQHFAVGIAQRHIAMFEHAHIAQGSRQLFQRLDRIAGVVHTDGVALRVLNRLVVRVVRAPQNLHQAREGEPFAHFSDRRPLRVEDGANRTRSIRLLHIGAHAHELIPGFDEEGRCPTEARHHLVHQLVAFVDHLGPEAQLGHAAVRERDLCT